MSEPDRRDFLVATTGGAFAFAPLLQPWPPRAADPAKLAVVGVGRQGRAILGELAKFAQAQVVAVCDVNEGRMRAGQRRAKDAEGFTSLSELLAKRADVQAVIVSTSTHQHKVAALEAMSAGKHVYCEAPLCHSVADCKELARAARGAKTRFAVGLQARSNPVYKLARSFARAGSLDRVVALRAAWNQKTSWQVGTEADMNWRLDAAVSTGLPGEVASHQVDVVNWFLNQTPRAVRGSGAVRLWEDGRTIPDSVELDLDYPDGPPLRFQASLCSSYEGQYELFRGSQSTIRMAETFGWMFKEADAPTQGWEVYASKERFHNDEGITLIADATKLAAQGKLKEGIGLPNPPLYYALEDFLKCVLEDKPPAASAEDGLRAAVIGIQAHAAVTSGKEQALSEDLFRLE
ncbi:MAG: Gfo/Idh/MocA family oxidoreductase [Planctomycetota bacterium]|nr:MAG: Gfo/Idh/MocA family oxidoreductase [Planctomycetota bacterium]